MGSNYQGLKSAIVREIKSHHLHSRLRGRSATSGVDLRYEVYKIKREYSDVPHIRLDMTVLYRGTLVHSLCFEDSVDADRRSSVKRVRSYLDRAIDSLLDDGLSGRKEMRDHYKIRHPSLFPSLQRP